MSQEKVLVTWAKRRSWSHGPREGLGHMDHEKVLVREDLGHGYVSWEQLLVTCIRTCWSDESRAVVLSQD